MSNISFKITEQGTSYKIDVSITNMTYYYRDKGGHDSEDSKNDIFVITGSIKNKLGRTSYPTDTFSGDTLISKSSVADSVQVGINKRTMAALNLNSWEYSESKNFLQITRITYPSTINSYNAVNISWSGVSGATSYVLERALNGSSSFIQVYSGNGTSYSDRFVSTITKVQYRVKAVNSGGPSGYKTGNLANVYYTKPNVAPTTPSSISVPSTVYGGKAFTVSWGASTDSDGNLSGYKLEQSYNSGSTWTQVYQGSATSTSITIPFGATTRVLYRVKAYDSDGAESGYKVSSKSDVIFFILCMKNRLYF